MFKKIVVRLCLILVIWTTVFSCTYEKAELKSDCVLPATVSFSQNIQPIFNVSCTIAGCHTGATRAGNLNLEASVAYSQLLASGTGYIDTLNPQNSLLYSKLTTDSDFMPQSGKLDNCKIKLVMEWIQQKAKNN